MRAKHCKRPTWCMLGMTLLATQNVWSGPLPLDQLMVSLRDTKAKLAVTQKTITDLESQILVAVKTVLKLTAVVRDGRTPDTAMDGDNAGGVEMIGRLSKASDPRIEEEAGKARAMLAEMRRSLVSAIGERRVLLNDLELILIQIAAWEEMEGSGE